MSKAPDFSRHPQVEPEQVVEKKIVFKIVEDSFDKAFRESKQADSEKPAWVDCYLKVGLFCGWTWNEFRETPYTVIKAIDKEIDNRLKNILSPGSFLSWQQIAVNVAIAKAFGSKDDD